MHNRSLQDKWLSVPCLGAIVLWAVLAGVPGQAQTVTPDRRLGTIDRPLPPIQPPPPGTLPTQPTPIPPSSPTAPVQQSPDVVPKTIRVLRYEVEGSTVFSQEELAEVAANCVMEIKPDAPKCIGDQVSFEQIRRARDAVQKLYTDHKYLTTGAYIPSNQNLEINGAVVKIRVVEGSLEEIRVKGTQRLDPGYIRSRLAIAAGTPLNQERLLEALRLLQLDPLIQSISAELMAGTERGTNLLEVTVVESKTFSALVSMDNNRTPSIGSWQRRGQLREANLLGLGDELVLAYTNTDGSNGGDFSYTLPLSPYNTNLTMKGGLASSVVVESPFNVLDIRSSSHYYEVGLSHPLIRSVNESLSRELVLGLTFSHQESTTSLLGIPFPLSAGADSQGQSRLSALRFSQDYIQRSSQEVWSLRSQFSWGLDALGATLNQSSPDSRFFNWQGQARWFRFLAPDTALLLRADIQVADRPLMALEQFAIGGQSSVRGYRRDALLADNGWFASMELQLPLLRIAQPDAVLQVIPFVDVGQVWNSGNTSNLSPNTLVSAGLGLQWRMGDFLARLDWGIPLVDLASRRNTWQENGLYLTVNYGF